MPRGVYSRKPKQIQDPNSAFVNKTQPLKKDSIEEAKLELLRELLALIRTVLKL